MLWYTVLKDHRLCNHDQSVAGALLMDPWLTLSGLMKEQRADDLDFALDVPHQMQVINAEMTLGPSCAWN